MFKFKQGDRVRVSDTQKYGYKGVNLYIHSLRTSYGYYVAKTPDATAYITWFADDHLELVPFVRSELEAAIAECEANLAAARKALDEFANPAPKVGDKFTWHTGSTLIHREILFIDGNMAFVKETHPNTADVNRYAMIGLGAQTFKRAYRVS